MIAQSLLPSLDSVRLPGHYRYAVYGMSVDSEIPLSLPASAETGPADLEVREGDSTSFSEKLQSVALLMRWDWYHYAHLDDGSSYVCWTGLGEFFVSPGGRRITCIRAEGASAESFQVYLLGQALSFALVKQGFEPLHATVVEMEGRAAVLLGRSGFGKSSLAASLLARGHRLVTDDLLILRSAGGRLMAYPGPPRLKLFRATARRFLGNSVSGVPMNSETGKLVIPIPEQLRCERPVRVGAIYALASPWENRRSLQIGIRRLSPKDSFLKLVGNTFNYMLVDAERLRRQLQQTTDVVAAVPVNKLLYPRSMKALPLVAEAIRRDLSA